MEVADNVGEIFCIGFCIHDAASYYWSELGLLGLSRRQYKVYDKKNVGRLKCVLVILCIVSEISRQIRKFLYHKDTFSLIHFRNWNIYSSS